MPRVKKITKKTKTKNKQKVVVKNYINVNSNNKRLTKPSKPSFSQMTQQPRQIPNSISTHFIQNPSSAFNPTPLAQQQQQNANSALLKSIETTNNLIKQFGERDARMMREDTERIGGKKLRFEEEPSFSFDGSPDAIREARKFDEILRGQKPDEIGIPQGSAFSTPPPPPPSTQEVSDEELRKKLTKMGRKELNDLLDDFTDDTPPKQKDKKIKVLMDFFRDETIDRVFTTEKKKRGRPPGSKLKKG